MFEDFIQSAGAPGIVLVSFGSMLDRFDKERTDILLEAFTSLNFKVIM